MQIRARKKRTATAVLFLHPNGGMVESVSFARAVGSQLARKQMFAQALPTTHIGSVCRARHLLRRAHPNGRAVESVSFARAVGGWFVREQMLACSLPAEHIGSVRHARHLLRRAAPE